MQYYNNKSKQSQQSQQSQQPQQQDIPMKTYSCSAKDQKFAQAALKASEKSTMKYHQHGCVAVMSGRIIARGWNTDQTWSNDGYLENACSCHAEVHVLRQLNKMLNKKGSSVTACEKRQYFLRTRKPVRCKKKQTRGYL